MKKIIIVLTLSAAIFSCGQPSSKTTYKSYDDVMSAFGDVINDTTSTWDQVIQMATIYIDSISAYTADANNLKHRLIGQDNGFLVIDLLNDKFEELTAAGKDANYDDILPLLDRFYDIEGVWFYSGDEQVPHIWRDHYYISHKDSDNPVHGYFHIMVTLPCEAYPEPTVQILYPDDAESEPILIFGKYLPNSAQDDPANRETIHLDNWSKKNEVEEGYPMYAKGGKDIVDKMLHYDVMYLMFLSGESKYGDAPGLEISRLELDHFQQMWKEVTGSR